MAERILEGIKITAYDTTLRDGGQTPGVTLSVDNKLRITQKLDEFGFPYIEGGWPGANDTDSEFFTEAKGLKLKHAQLAAFGMTGRIGVSAQNDDGLDTLLKSEAGILTIFGKSWMLHVREALRTTGLKNLDTIHNTVSHLRNNGRRVFYDAEHFYDGFADNPNYALESLEAAKSAGAEVIILCDTNGGSTPEFVHEATRAVKERFTEMPLGIHVHNDGGLAVANTLAAIRAGATQVQGTVNGAGERTGNVDFCVFLPTAKYKYGADAGLDLTGLKDLSGFVELENGLIVPPNTPYVGENAFRHKGGVHVSAMRRHPEAYQHIDPKLVGSQTSYEHSDQGGGANALEMARKHGFELSSNDPEYSLVVDAMKQLRNLGDAQEFLTLCRILRRQADPFDVLEGSQVINSRGSNPVASVRVRVNGDSYQETAVGNGPINAFDHALRKALTEKYPEVEDIRLLHYKVPDTQRIGTEAEVSVHTTFGIDGQRWTSIARGTNQQETGENALVDGYKYYILKNGVKV